MYVTLSSFLISFHQYFYVGILWMEKSICVEFREKMDPNLPFYYFRNSHHRYYVGTMPDFSKKPVKPRKQKRAPRRELLGSIGRHVSYPVRGTLSVHAIPTTMFQSSFLPFQMPVYPQKLHQNMLMLQLKPLKQYRQNITP